MKKYLRDRAVHMARQGLPKQEAPFHNEQTTGLQFRKTRTAKWLITRSLILVLVLGGLFYLPEFADSGSPYVCPAFLSVFGIPFWTIAAFLGSALFSSLRRTLNPNAPPGRLIPTVPFFVILIAVTVAAFVVALPFEPFALTFGVCGPTGIFGL